MNSLLFPHAAKIEKGRHKRSVHFADPIFATAPVRRGYMCGDTAGLAFLTDRHFHFILNMPENLQIIDHQPEPAAQK